MPACRSAGTAEAGLSGSGSSSRHTLAVAVTYNSAAVVGGLLSSLDGAFAGLPHDLVVVDNASTDDTLAVVARHAPGARVHRLDRNTGYAAGVNRAVAGVRPGGALLVLNADVQLSTGAARLLLDGLDEPGTGITVPLLSSESGAALPSLRREPSVLRALGEAVLGGHRAGRVEALGEVVVEPDAYRRPSTADWATGAVMMVSEECLSAVGPWDESFFLYSEETDFALRARDAGFATRLVPGATAVHVGGEGMTSPSLYALLTLNRRRLFRARHGAAESAAFTLALALNEVLRLRRPVHRAALRALITPGAHRRIVAGLGGPS